MFCWFKFLDAADITNVKKRHGTVTIPSWVRVLYRDGKISVGRLGDQGIPGGINFVYCCFCSLKLIIQLIPNLSAHIPK